METKATQVKKIKKKGKKDLKQKIIDFAKSKFKFDMVTFLHKTMASCCSFRLTLTGSSVHSVTSTYHPVLALQLNFPAFPVALHVMSFQIFQYTSGSLQIHTALSAYVISVA